MAGHLLDAAYCRLGYFSRVSTIGPPRTLSACVSTERPRRSTATWCSGGCKDLTTVNVRGTGFFVINDAGLCHDQRIVVDASKVFAA
ncbi:hypothetical protein ATK36_4368 [Amycolatopsis sulphurea]|uniref:Uncharacterized protein n=1 Tax=Amycolatopsis sulphurea TaxID=76022 RepID=A0A2A9FDH9_9PSEU|nr:hypothetical protein ATK36_4368 [Amycolatopsis sulphurea]